jgi:hypothetical protein
VSFLCSQGEAVQREKSREGNSYIHTAFKGHSQLWQAGLDIFILYYKELSKFSLSPCNQIIRGYSNQGSL